MWTAENTNLYLSSAYCRIQVVKSPLRGGGEGCTPNTLPLDPLLILHHFDQFTLSNVQTVAVYIKCPFDCHKMTRIVLFLLLGWKVLMNFLIGWFLDTLCVPLYVPFMCIFFLPSERERFWQTKWTRCWLCRAGYWLLVSKVECTVLKKTYLNSFHIRGQFARSSWDFHIVAITLCGGFFLYVCYSCFFK